LTRVVARGFVDHAESAATRTRFGVDELAQALLGGVDLLAEKSEVGRLQVRDARIGIVDQTLAVGAGSGPAMSGDLRHVDVVGYNGGALDFSERLASLAG
jgi:hypothetical protein